MNTSLRTLWDRLKKLQGSPVALARGTAVGVFIGITPLTPLQTLLIVAITIASRCSTIAGVLACALVCNPLTILPFYYFSWLIGDWLFPDRLTWSVLQATVDQMRQAGVLESLAVAGQLGLDAVMVLLTGGTILALPFGVVSYPLALRFFLRLERIRRDRHLLNRRDEQGNT